MLPLKYSISAEEEVKYILLDGMVSFVRPKIGIRIFNGVKLIKYKKGIRKNYPGYVMVACRISISRKYILDIVAYID